MYVTSVACAWSLPPWLPAVESQELGGSLHGRSSVEPPGAPPPAAALLPPGPGAEEREPSALSEESAVSSCESRPSFGAAPSAHFSDADSGGLAEKRSESRCGRPPPGRQHGTWSAVQLSGLHSGFEHIG